MRRHLAMEGGPLGIRVNTIGPALVETAATKFMIKRTGQPEDIGWFVVYLG